MNLGPAGAVKSPVQAPTVLTTYFIMHPGAYPPTGLIAQRINVYRGMESYKPAADHAGEAEGDATVSSSSYLLNFDIKQN